MITATRRNRSLKTIVLLMTVLLTFTLCSEAAEQTDQVKIEPTSLPESVPLPPQLSETLYTENIDEFKSKKYNQRLEGLVGCWLMSKEYLDLHKSNYLFFKDLQLKEVVSLKLVKQCLRKINRKQAILKITELVGKNIEPAKKYEDIVDIKIVDSIFEEVSKLTIANYNQYQPINQEEIGNESLSESVDAFNISQNVQTDKRQFESKSFKEMSEFDLFLTDLLQKYNEEFQKLVSSKEGLKGKVEEELKKRQKYYFGFIPASSFTHSVFLVTISLSMVFCCTCFKYYRMRSKEKQERRKSGQECEDGCKSHSHGHGKYAKKVPMAKMTEITMKKKTR